MPGFLVPDVSSFRYQSTQPTNPVPGEIWIDSDEDVPVVGSTQSTRWKKIAAGGETTLSGLDDNSLTLTYSLGYEQVFVNGTLLSRYGDYTASSGTSVILAQALVAGDIVEIITLYVGAITQDAYTQTQSDAKYVNKNVGGLNLVVPTSVTGGTVSANGAITIGSGVTSIAVNGVFSSLYDNYKILFFLDNHNGGASVEFQLQGITSGYFTTGYYQSFGVSTMTGYSSASTSVWYMNFNNQATYSSAFQMELMSPNLSKRKVCAVTGQGANGPSQISGTNNSTVQSTGFTITKTGDTMTGGTIRIYGYNNGA